MSKRLRIRLLLIVAACVMGAGAASAMIQRSASNADLREYEVVTSMRAALLEQDAALQRAERTRSARAVADYQRGRSAFERATGDATDYREAEEAELMARQRRLARIWTDSADRSLAGLGSRDWRATVRRGERDRDDALRGFMSANREMGAILKEERTARQRDALLLPLGLVAILTLFSGAILWVSVERPARAEQRRRGQQTELSEALQVARTEPEAYAVLARHLARAARSEHVTIFNRNNSADRLEPVTPIRDGSAVAAGLEGAAPDSCLAVRMARPHAAEPGVVALMSCDVCGKSPDRTTCVPALVGGEVIGSVLVEHARPLPELTAAQLGDSVAEAAPVVANLRNLAIAEQRAATDALTGLPNQRAVHETLKRMVAQAGRTLEPLAAVLFDLDHFKQINDTLGHSKGDDVLAAVGDAAASAVRGSDFAGRLGGEEFAILLPGTDRQGAVKVAENLRAAIAALSVVGVERRITASFGVAVLPDEAADAQSLLRLADRALYQAKANGRDRVETTAAQDAPTMVG